jgi:2-keto-3-deoxy-6-phosphogluconate aldolase
VGGPEFVKNVMGPMPWTRIMPTGGVEPTEESLRKWFGAGIVACGIGSNLITKEAAREARLRGHRGARARHRQAHQDHSRQVTTATDDIDTRI